MGKIIIRKSNKVSSPYEPMVKKKRERARKKDRQIDR